jgi:glutamate 5-kinase
MIPNKRKQRVVIKVGSSSLTSRHGEISRMKLEKLVREIAQLRDLGHEVVLVSSGAVAAGYRKLGCLERPSTLPEKQAAASIGQGLLMESYSDLFISHGYIAAQILITRADFLDEDHYQNVRNTLNVLIERGIVPIVNENDTVTIDRLKFGDNDTLSAKVAGLIDAETLIILSDIDGLYDADPSEEPTAKLLSYVSEITPAIEAAAGGSTSNLGTGGMSTKIEAVKIAMASGITTFLGNAALENIVVDAVYEQAKGTYFKGANQTSTLNQKKKWIAFHSGPEGAILLKSSGVNRLLIKRENLLASDIQQISGPFCKGAVIRILDYAGSDIGLGIIQYPSEELEKLMVTSYKQNMSDTSFILFIDDFVCHLDVPISAVGI